MSDEQAATKKRSKRLCVLWGIALTLLLSTALFCWLVVVPVWRVRAGVEDYVAELREGAVEASDSSGTTIAVLPSTEIALANKCIDNLGGPVEATRLLAKYLRAPDRICSHKTDAINLLTYCGKRPELTTYPSEGPNGYEGDYLLISPTEQTSALDEVLRVLIQNTHNGDSKISAGAVRGLGWLRQDSAEAVERLKAMTRDASVPSSVRTAAAEAARMIITARKLAARSLREVVEQDVGVAIGGSFSLDHLGYDSYSDTAVRLIKNAAACHVAIRKKYLGSAFDAKKTSQCHILSLLRYTYHGDREGAIRIAEDYSKHLDKALATYDSAEDNDKYFKTLSPEDNGVITRLLVRRKGMRAFLVEVKKIKAAQEKK